MRMALKNRSAVSTRVRLSGVVPQSDRAEENQLVLTVERGLAGAALR